MGRGEVSQGRKVSHCCPGSGHQAGTARAESWSASRFLAGLQLAELTLLKRKLCQILALKISVSFFFREKGLPTGIFRELTAFQRSL